MVVCSTIISEWRFFSFPSCTWDCRCLRSCTSRALRGTHGKGGKRQCNCGDKGNPKCNLGTREEERGLVRVLLISVAMCLLLVGCRTDDGLQPNSVQPTEQLPNNTLNAKRQATLGFLSRQAEINEQAVNKLIVGRTGSLLVVDEQLTVDDSILLATTPNGPQFVSNSFESLRVHGTVNHEGEISWRGDLKRMRNLPLSWPMLPDGNPEPLTQGTIVSRKGRVNPAPATDTELTRVLYETRSGGYLSIPELAGEAPDIVQVHLTKDHVTIHKPGAQQELKRLAARDWQIRWNSREPALPPCFLAFSPELQSQSVIVLEDGTVLYESVNYE